MNRRNDSKWDKASEDEGALFRATIAMNVVLSTLKRAGLSTESAVFVKEQIAQSQKYQRKLLGRVEQSTRACKAHS